MTKKRLLVFASGEKNGGGSGFQELVENSRTGVLEAEIIGAVCNIHGGGVEKRANELNVPFFDFSGEKFLAEEYQDIVNELEPDFISLSGWLKLVRGLNPRITINIHPGSLPRFGGDGMYGHHVHEAVIHAFQKGEITQSAVTMHFVTEEYDKGPIFFQYPVQIRENDTPEILAGRVNKIEHAWQSYITNLVVTGQIFWDGKNPSSLLVPNHVPLHFLNP